MAWLALVCVSAPARAQALEVGDVVARVELGAPAQASFVLRATIPVPPRVFPRADGRSPFALRSPTGLVSGAQVEIVSRWPRGQDGADVVEVLGRVELPPGTPEGRRVSFDVLFHPHRADVFRSMPRVEELFAQGEAIQLRATDVFGHVYVASPLRALQQQPEPRRLRTLREGPVALQEVVHDMLMPVPPVAGPTGTLPHLFGAHSYLTRWRDEEFFSLDLRIHNGPSGLDTTDHADDPLGTVYFKNLELVLPRDWTVIEEFQDPFFGPPRTEGSRTVWPIVRELPGGKMHVIPAMGQFHRRLVIAVGGKEGPARSTLEQATLAFCVAGNAPDGRALWSWWNPQTARYFPQRHVLPSLDFVGLRQIREGHQSELDTRVAQHAGLQPVTWPVLSSRMGWCAPWGTSAGGMAGGTEIYLWDGVDVAAAASGPGYRLTELVHEMFSCRQPNVLYDLDGLHTQPESWVISAAGRQILPVWWFNGPMFWAADPFGYSNTPDFQRLAVYALGLRPDYEAELMSFQMIDQEHLVRYTRSPKVLVWLGNDALARDDLRSQAEGIRFTFNDRPQSQWGAVIPTGLLHAQEHVQHHPGQGLAYGRAEGWGLDLMCAAYSILDKEWRQLTRPWFDEVIDVLEQGQATCTNIIQATPMGNVFGGQYRNRQSIECAITEHALVGMRESVFAGGSPARVTQLNGVLERSVRSMLSPLVWSDQLHGPLALFAVGPADVNQPSFCNWIPSDGNYGIADHYQVWSSFAYGYEITGDPIFLVKAQEMAGGGSLLPSLYSAGLDNLQNKAALIALLQELGS